MILAALLTTFSSRFIQQMHDDSGLSCSIGGTPTVNIVPTAGSMPSAAAYDTFVYEVDSSDDGEFEYVITDLTPGIVSFRFQPHPIFRASEFVCLDFWWQ